MNFLTYGIQSMDQFRGNEFSPEGFGVPEGMDPQVSSQAPTAAGLQHDAANHDSGERDERLEAFMKDIKDFIRNIDISKL